MDESLLFGELVGGRRVYKDHPRLALCGTIDEANAVLGIARAVAKDEDKSKIIYQIQQNLLILGSECATPLDMIDRLPRKIEIKDIYQLDQMMDEIKRRIKKLPTSFVIPGDSLSSAALHLARSIIRRAERIAVKLRRDEEIREEVVRYLDKLSEALFYLAI